MGGRGLPDAPEWVRRGSHDSIWASVCLVIAVAQILAGVIGFATGSPVRSANPSWLYPVYIVQIGVYAGTAGLLITAGNKDRRAVYLGFVYLFTASTFAGSLIPVVPPSSPALALTADILASIQLFALAPLFLWLFAMHFPRTPESRYLNRLTRIGFVVSLFAGVGVTLWNLIVGPAFDIWGLAEPSRLFHIMTYRGDGSFFWTVISVLLLAVVPVIVRKREMAPTEERRRVELFTWGLALTMGLVYLSVFLDSSIPSIQSFLAARRTLYFSIAYPLMAMTPLATSYSVLVDRVFDIRFIVRKAIQYALARSTVLTLTALPFAFLIVLLYQQRSQTLASLLEGTRSLALVAAVIVGLAAYRIRGRVLTAIDRQFFRDHYDTNRILANLVERTRMTSSSQELSDLLRRELDRAIHPEKVIIVLLDTGKAVLRSLDDMCRPLDLTSELVAMVEAQQSPVSVDPHFGRSLFGELPDEDRSWVTAHGVTLLAPLIGSTGALVGIIALGPKKSELPYSAEDRTLMSAIAASSALVAENRINAETPAVRHPMDPSLPDPAPAGNGRFCPSCNRIETAGTKTCPECGRAMDDASVPCVLAGKFRIEVRVGTGGMGVVYRAVDLTLRRKVAVKTLPRISAVASARLRQEARAIAAVQHPNLALIHGAESWHGVPFLIFEYFGAGTLADRLSDGPLSATETVEIGIALANALERIHRIGMLHRDIKPSNIGLTDEGTPKLMDFGLARLYSWMDWEDRVPEIQSDPGRTMTAPAFETESRGTGLAGTPIYMSPEAVQGRPPSPASDLWALAIVLYECLAGKHPLSECAPEQLLTAIREGRFPGIEALVPACPPNLGAFFAAALSPHILDRPQSARELAGHLRRLRFP